MNIGHIYYRTEEISEAASAWVTAYQIAKKTNFAQTLQALANLAPQLGLPPGLDGWEQLAQRMNTG
jgi:hypothetical protein